MSLLWWLRNGFGKRERERQTKGMKKKGHMIEPEKTSKFHLMFQAST